MFSQAELAAIAEERLAMEREKATMRRSMLVAQQQLTTAQSEAADVRGANSKALATAEDAVLQLQRRLTEQVCQSCHIVFALCICFTTECIGTAFGIHFCLCERACAVDTHRCVCTTAVCVPGRLRLLRWVR